MEYKKKILIRSVDANQYSEVSAKRSSGYMQKPTSSVCLPLSGAD